MNKPAPANRIVQLADGVDAVAPGLAFIRASRSLIAADIHLGYEDVIGAALPTWSTREIVDTLIAGARETNAREIVLLGDVIHGSRMSEGAARQIRAGLDAMREFAQVTIVAGNHEGRSRGAAVLGETVEHAERDGWVLLHGDKPPSAALLGAGRFAIGHLHPSLALDRGTKAPAFLAGRSAIVVPALTPYSGGLDVRSDACLAALAPFNVTSRSELHVVVVTEERCYPFGSLSELCRTTSSMK